MDKRVEVIAPKDKPLITKGIYRISIPNLRTGLPK